MRKDASAREVNLAAAREFEKWSQSPETISPAGAAGAGLILTVGELTEVFVLAHVSSWSHKTVTAYTKRTERIEEFFGSGYLLSSLNLLAAEQFKIWLTKQKAPAGKLISGRTVNNTLQHASCIMEYAVRLDLIQKNPFKYVTPVAQERVRLNDPFEPEEIKRILETAYHRYSWFFPVVLVLAITGGRRGPLPLLRVADFKLDDMTLFIPDETAKQKKGNLLALPPVVARELDRITAGRHPDEPLFLTDQGKPLNIKAFDPPAKKAKKIPPCRTWYRLLEEAGVRPRSVHNMRRGLVSNLARENITLDRITAVTGQTVEVARQHYLKIDIATQRETMAHAVQMYAIEKLNGETAEVVEEAFVQITQTDAWILVHFYQGFMLMNGDSGTNSGTKGSELNMKGWKHKPYRELAERGGFEPPIRVYPV